MLLLLYTHQYLKCKQATGKRKIIITVALNNIIHSIVFVSLIIIIRFTIYHSWNLYYYYSNSGVHVTCPTNQENFFVFNNVYKNLAACVFNVLYIQILYDIAYTYL